MFLLIQYVVRCVVCFEFMCGLLFSVFLWFEGYVLAMLEWPNCWGLFNISSILWWPSSIIDEHHCVAMIIDDNTFWKSYQVGENISIILHEWLRWPCIFFYCFSITSFLLLNFSSSWSCFGPSLLLLAHLRYQFHLLFLLILLPSPAHHHNPSFPQVGDHFFWKIT